MCTDHIILAEHAGLVMVTLNLFAGSRMPLFSDLDRDARLVPKDLVLSPAHPPMSQILCGTRIPI